MQAATDYYARQDCIRASRERRRPRRRGRADAEIRCRRACHLRHDRCRLGRGADGRAYECRGARQNDRQRGGLVLQPFAPRVVEEGRNIRPHATRRRDADRLRSGRGLDQGASRPAAPAIPAAARASIAQCRSARLARSHSNSATSACSIRKLSIQTRSRSGGPFRARRCFQVCMACALRPPRSIEVGASSREIRSAARSRHRLASIAAPSASSSDARTISTLHSMSSCDQPRE